MPDDKILHWVRSSSSTLPKNCKIIHDFVEGSYLKYFDFLCKKISKSGYRKQKISYQSIYRQLSRESNDKDRHPQPTIGRYIFNWDRKSTVLMTTVFAGLCLICNLSSMHWTLGHRPLLSLPQGGVLLPARGATSSVLTVLPRWRQRQPTHHHSGFKHLSSAMQGFCHPLQGKGFLSQGTRAGTHQGRMEYAYDFGTPIGTPVYAMQAGRVLGVRDIYTDNGGNKRNAERFNFVWLQHTNGVGSAYIHLQQNFRSRISIKPHDWVKAGQLIGYSGNSGWSSAPHLHVEVHRFHDAWFGQTIPFVIASKCPASKVAKG